MAAAALRKDDDDRLQPVFRALADPTRRRILRDLAREPASIADVASRFEISRPAVVKHLAILREGGLIAIQPKGRERINVLKPEGLRSAAEWLTFFDAFWDEKLARLKLAVESDVPTSPKGRKHARRH
ncbi:MAG TPA: metalloregulator ArsR/SmtB family transcription factor [Hyphomonadaceae bacterium]|jgi:DNA-binding transcriptional ArsR family regulator